MRQGPPSQSTPCATRTAHAYRRILAMLADRTDLDTIARTAAILARDLFAADGATVTRVEGHEALYIAAVGHTEAMLHRRLPIAGSFTGEVVATRAALAFDPQSAPAASVARARLDTIASGIVCPILLEGQVLGTIGVTSQQGNAFHDDDIDRLQAFADFLALGLERNRNQRHVERTAHFCRLGDFSATLCSSLQQPLDHLLAALTALRPHCQNHPGAQRDLSLAFHQVEAIARLNQDLRLLNEVWHDSGGLERLCDLNDTLRALCTHLEDRINLNAELNRDLTSEPLPLRASPARLWQVGYALLVNAIEAMEARPKPFHRLEVRSFLSSTAFGFSVVDTGVGIPEDQHDLLFEPFFTTKTGPSRGLGLTLVWHYVNALGGAIDIHSNPGLGTRVQVRFQTPNRPPIAS